MLEIGVISDTHLAHAKELPKALTEKLSRLDLILHAGDLVSMDVLNGLKKLGPEVKAVCGNMDTWQLKKLLPQKLIFEAGGIRIGLTHGSGAPFNLISSVKNVFKDERLGCIVFGHSHLVYNQKHQGTLFLNPGSPTDNFFAPYNSFGILQIDKQIRVKIVRL